MSGYEDAMSALAMGAEVEVPRPLPAMIFMCGCRTGDNPSPSQISTDPDGFVICAEHGTRRYGWRSLPFRRFDLATYGPLVIEKHLIFGEPLPKVTLVL